ncbi:MAG: indole-3-glycerol phosphate synthase TrpC [Actinomycetota bacterium]|nr:indole-3-glycerol phosphate synthase TrpC [Actinomycetota bacterium]
MSRFLQSMEQSSRARLQAARSRRPLAVMVEQAMATPAPRGLGDFGEVFDLVGEIKPRSPAEGELGAADLVERAVAYQEGGAKLLSVLTEPDAFGGSLDLLEAVSIGVEVSVLRKDFLVDPYQVFEARAAGADGVLIIARILNDQEMRLMLDAVDQTGMYALVEAFDTSDLERVTSIVEARAGLLVGVNCRDLDTLRTEPAIHEQLASGLPTQPPVVAESGMLGPADIGRVAALGYRGALVGSALMRSNDPAGLMAAMLAMGRETAKVSAS